LFKQIAFGRESKGYPPVPDFPLKIQRVPYFVDVPGIWCLSLGALWGRPQKFVAHRKPQQQVVYMGSREQAAGIIICTPANEMSASICHSARLHAE